MAKRKAPLGECPNAALYGIAHSNRNFKDPFYWGKNQFNSSFPIALCCYMRDSGKNALGIQMEKDLTTSIKELSFNKVFGTTLPIKYTFALRQCLILSSLLSKTRLKKLML